MHNAFENTKALYFDLAGTLCDIPIGNIWDDINLKGIEKVFEELGFFTAFTTEEIQAYKKEFVAQKAILRKKAKTDLYEYEIKQQISDFLFKIKSDDTKLQKHLSQFTFNDELLLRLEHLFISTELGITVSFPESREVLEALNEKWEMHLLSNNASRMLVDEIVEKLDFGHLFEKTFVSADIGYRKPHENFIRAVVEQTNHKPEECVMIGDRLTQDIQMAHDFGMKAIHAAMVEHADNTGAGEIPYDAQIRNLQELKELLL
ncbi:MAG: HAD family hydrolase [Spirochaetia bacterium]